jgi:Zn-dependent protease
VSERTPSPTFGGAPALFRFRGIAVRMHWTFLLLVAWVVFSSWNDEDGWAPIGGRLLDLLLLFACVVLHEFGHALMARHYGVGTRDITLLPIGGVASLERMPTDPWQELWITAAGPLVNLVLATFAAVLIAILPGGYEMDGFLRGPFTLGTLLNFLLTTNAVLFLFNLIPAFPMDGGRILRALLAMRMHRTKATRIASAVGRTLALCLVALGLVQQEVTLVLLGAFVFLSAGAENRAAQQQGALHGTTARQVMRTHYWQLAPHATVDEAVDGLLAGGDTYALVLAEGRLVGMLDARSLLQAVREGRGHDAVGSLVLLATDVVSADEEGHQAYTTLLQSGHTALPVVQGEFVVGLLDQKNLQEYMAVQQARTAR